MRQATSPSPKVMCMYEQTTSLWFCSYCKYLPCDKCSKTRVTKRELRFQTWTCAGCKKSTQQDGQGFKTSTQQDRQMEAAAREACQLPQCAQRTTHAKTPVASNSWVAKKKYFKEVATPSSHVKNKYAATDSLWFCHACKYPPCKKVRCNPNTENGE